MRKFLIVILAALMSIQLLAMRTPTEAAAKNSTSDSANAAAVTSFRFVSWGDSQDNNTGLAVTSSQANSLNPAFTIFNGDLENDGVTQSRMDAMTAGFGSLLPETFLIRGNHDDQVSGSAGLWENYFTALNRPLPSGVTNYSAMNSSSTYLTYSFDYANSRFIGVDVPGDADLLTSAELTFLDNRLTDAESLGLTHAFIFWHGPEYCVESTHCGCTAKLDGSCTPSALITIFNKHAIVSATFHGHEHILGWVHMDNSRVPGITHPYEQFLTSSSTDYNSYNAYMYPARMDYYYPNVGNGSGFAAMDVNGDSFTFNIYKVGTTAPVWSKTFSKSGTVPTDTPVPTTTVLPTSTPTQTRTPTPTPTKTRTSVASASPTKTRTSGPTPTPTKTGTSVATLKGAPPPAHHYVFLPMIIRNLPLHGGAPMPTQTSTYKPTKTATKTSRPVATNTPRPTATKTSKPVATNTPVTGTRPLKYYLVDRVLNNADFAKLAGWGINTAIVDFKVAPQSGTIAQWDSTVNAAAAAGIKVVIWPDGHQGRDVSGCRWETPFDKADINNGSDYIVNVKPILDHFGNNPNVIGIVTAHEPVWIQNAATEAACNENIAGMTIIKTQIYDYINNTVHRNASYAPFKVWNYIDNIYNISNLSDYNAANKAAQIAGIMDVAVIWQHCAGYPTYAGDGSACEGTGHYTALGGIDYDRNTMIVPNGLEGKVEEVFIMQTFKQGSSGAYAGKFTLSELEKYSCDFVNSGSLDGFGFYTWDEGWYTGNLKSFTDLQPAVPYIRDTCGHAAP